MTVVRVAGAEPLREGACRVIAEAGANHNNSVDRAIEMAIEASEAGAWAVKYQLYKAERISVRNSPKYWNDEIGTSTQFEAFQLSDRLAYSDYQAVAEACRDLGVIFFATPFDPEAIEALEAMDVPIYKIASGDITHRPLLEALADTGKPLLLSTGASTLGEIEDALEWMGVGPERVVLLACTLTYPTPDPDGNFSRIDTLRQHFAPHLVGMSDHTLGVAGGWMTSALGGVCIEKHYTLDKTLGEVPDHAISVDPPELAELVEAANRGAILRGDPSVGVRASEEPARASARRSIVARTAIPAGTRLAREHLDFKRPSGGLAPSDLEGVLGRTTERSLEADERIEISDLD